MKIFTDGSCLNNKDSKKGLSKGAIGVFFGDNDPKNISEILTCNKITNQVAELMAVNKALDIINEIKYQDIIYIYTDSKYVIGIFTEWLKNWKKSNWKTSFNKPIQNVELIKQIDTKLQNKTIIFKHIRSHQIEPDHDSELYDNWYGNMMADKLATMAYKKIEKK